MQRAEAQIGGLLRDGMEDGYLVSSASTLALTGAGQRLAADVERALNDTRAQDSTLHYRPYTEYLPTGKEDLR
jgi:hypothetical protein